MNMVNVLFILALNHYTGVTTWAYELMKGFNQFNIDVVFISDNPYLISEKEYTKDVSQYANAISSVDFNKKYDVVLLHNTDHEDIAKRVGENTIFVSHSSMVDNAKPKLKHNKHITISGRSKYVLGADKFILNGIDLDKFKSNSNVNEIPKVCLYHNRIPPQDFVFGACRELNIKLIFWNVIESDVREKIDKSDFVMGYGRSVYEAMSMGKPVLVFGHNSPVNEDELYKTGISSNRQGGYSDGWVDESNFKKLLYRNCSGWSKKIYIDNKNDMISMIKGYDYKMGNVNRALSEKYLSSVSMVNSFEKLIYEIT